MVPVTLAFAAGIGLDRLLDTITTAFWLGLATVSVAAAVAAWRWPRLGAAATLAGALAMGGVRHHAAWSDRAPDDASRASVPPAGGLPVWIRGRIAAVPAWIAADGSPGSTDRTVTTIDLTSIQDAGQWRGASGRWRLSIAGDRSDLTMGRAVEAAGTLSPIGGPMNPGEPDLRGALRAQGIRMRLSVGDISGVWPDSRGQSSRAWAWLGALRVAAYRRVMAMFAPDVAGLATALLLGRRDGLDPAVQDAFAATGTTHVLAISGMHLQVIAMGVWGLASVVGLGRRASVGLAVAVAAGYGLIVGPEPSVVRSVATTLVVGAAVLASRSHASSPGNVLAVAALVTLVLSPTDLFHIGGQLSFLAVAGLVWAVGPALRAWRERMPRPVLGRGRGHLGLGFDDPSNPLDAYERSVAPRWLRWVRGFWARVWDAFLLSLIVGLLTTPLMAWRFHLVSPVSVVLNIPLVPLTSVALGLGGLAVVMSPLLPLPARLAAGCAGGFLRASEWLVRRAGALGGGHAFVAGPSLVWMVVTYLGLAAVAWSPRVRSVGWRRLSMVGALWVCVGIGSVLVAPLLTPSRLEAEVLAVGHGLAVVIRAPDGSAHLYDCGKQGDPRVGRRIIAPALWARGVGSLDTVILSHPDADHYGGLPDLLERVRIGAVGVSPSFLDSAQRDLAVASLLAEIRAHGVPIRKLAAGPLDRDGMVEVIRSPDAAGAGATDNERSIVLAVGHPGHRFYLTGDLEGRGQLDWMDSTPAGLSDAGVILAPHHGSRVANARRFYDWSRPHAVIVSQEPPRAGTRDALTDVAARGLPVLRTWQRGALRLTFDAGGITIRGFLDGGPVVPGTPAPRPLRAGPDDWMMALVAVAMVGVLATLMARRLIDRIARVLIQPRGPEAPTALAPPPWESARIMADDGVSLFAEFLDVAEARGRTIVLLHGFAEDHEALQDRATFLSRQGWSVLLPDQRGRGRSGGKFCTFGALESGDLRRWLDWLETRGAGPIAVWGRSMGAAVAIRAIAANGDPRVRALVLEAPYASLGASLTARLRGSRLPAAPWFARRILERATRLTGQAIEPPSPIDLAGEVDRPALVLVGLDDPVATPAEVHRLAAALGGPVEIVEVPGAGHVDVYPAGGPELEDRLSRFLDENSSDR
jgi:competence protein ComEC